jgi:hypothetical protein
VTSKRYRSPTKPIGDAIGLIVLDDSSLNSNFSIQAVQNHGELDAEIINSFDDSLDD